jgi:phosphoribosylformylglycinamidine synthase
MNSIKEISSTVIAIKGKTRLSEFRINSLKKNLQVKQSIDDLECYEIYFLSLNRKLSQENLNKLKSILFSSSFFQSASDVSFTVIPRLGTISPWSSKATEILRNCGFDFLNRIERGFHYSVGSKDQFTIEDTRELAKQLVDRMTQDVILDLSESESIFSSLPPQSVFDIPMFEEGISAIEDANISLGLALNADEISYLYKNYLATNANPTDAELMMFAQANSEHCRHKIFNASWNVNSKDEPLSLFDMIRNTHALNPDGVLSAYEDNAAILSGFISERFYPTRNNIYGPTKEEVNIVIKVETHNHPTAISPFSGAATGSGGEIRDEGATGVGAKPKAGLSGFSVSNLRIPGLHESWEIEENTPGRIAKPLQIMLEAPIGSAAFNNEFGRPNILGYFRSFEMEGDVGNGTNRYGYHKPIMLAGGLGNIKPEHTNKSEVPIGSKLVVLGGPAMLIGLGGGSASSLSSGSGDLDLDYASVQRENPEMERRCQEVLDRCWQEGSDNPILFIHDVGAGGLSNAVPELVKDSGHGGLINLREIPNAEPGMSPMEIWCNESQERYVIAIDQSTTDKFKEFCSRERCPFAVIGEITEGSMLEVYDSEFDNYPINLSLDILFGKPPKSARSYISRSKNLGSIDLSGYKIEELFPKVLRHPTVASKNFLITIGDRTVTGLIARDQLVGPWQVPVADHSISSSGFTGTSGEAMSIGERTPNAVLNPAATSRLSVAESVTNILSSGIKQLSDIKLSANWMGAPDRLDGDQDLYEAVEAIGMELCPEWKITIPVGKDSLSMATDWNEGEEIQSVVSPLSLIISAFAPLEDISLGVTPQIIVKEKTELLFIDLAKGYKRLGGSIAAQINNILAGNTPDVECVKEMPLFVECIHQLLKEKKILSYHDRSDGGLLTTISEMAFAGRVGVDVFLDEILSNKNDYIDSLLNEELGVVIQINSEERDAVIQCLQRSGLKDFIYSIGTLNDQKEINLIQDNKVSVSWSLKELLEDWSRVGFEMQSLRDNPATAKEEFLSDVDVNRQGLSPRLTFSIPSVANLNQNKPLLAVLREQGVNGQVEMAAAFDRAGFSCVDVHMTDLIKGKYSLGEFSGMVACGGFSYGDVLGAGGGWATNVLHNEELKNQFSEFFLNERTFTLGVCNGCQTLALLSSLIPGSNGWPKFIRNTSEKFESRLVQTVIKESPSIFFKGMAGSILPIPVAHGEGRVSSSSEEVHALEKNNLTSLAYADNLGFATEAYPDNPNGSFGGVAGITNESGRVTLMMPHPERAFLSYQYSWCPEDWQEYGPWMKFFLNAREFVD